MWTAARAPLLGLTLTLLVVLGARSFGLLQGIELRVYDEFLRRATPEASPARVTILEITERDITEQGHWPIADRELARALRRLLAGGARVVGLDLYRDLPVPPGSADFEAVLREADRVVVVQKFGDRRSQEIPAPPALRGTDRVGFNDLLVDRDDQVRRGLLFLHDGRGHPSYSFALRLALGFLEAEGVRPAGDPDHPGWLRLGPHTLRPIRADDGGYVDADDAGHQFFLDFAGGHHGFDRVSLGALQRGDFDPSVVRDRIVLVGVTAESVRDYHATPLARGTDVPQSDPPGSRRVPGVVLHADAVHQLVRIGLGETRPLRTLSDAAEVALIVGLALLGTLPGLRARGLVFVLCLAGGIFAAFGLGLTAFGRSLWIPIAAPALAYLGAAGTILALRSSGERAERALLMQLFSRHVSPAVADQIWEQRHAFMADGRPEPRRLIATVVFTDIRNYSERAEQMDPVDHMRWINAFLEPMARKVAEFGGIVDDYFGDGMKADFGVPIPRDSADAVGEDARRAVACARAMADELTRLNRDYVARGQPTVAMRIGIHTGPVVAGSVGTAGRLKYTVVGDVVVTAQRLESLDRVEHDPAAEPCRILVSDETAAHLGPDTGHTYLGAFMLKGKDRPVGIHRVPSAGPAAPPADEV